MEENRGQPESLEDFERNLGERMRAFERDLTAEQLARYDIDAQVILVGRQEMRRRLDKEDKEYLSASGPVTVKRNLFRPSGGGKSVCPLELRAGIVGGLCTPVLARQVTYSMGHMTSAETKAGSGSSSSTRPQRRSTAYSANRNRRSASLLRAYRNRRQLAASA